jgi:hypothetical protein
VLLSSSERTNSLSVNRDKNGAGLYLANTAVSFLTRHGRRESIHWVEEKQSPFSEMKRRIFPTSFRNTSVFFKREKHSSV